MANWQITAVFFITYFWGCDSLDSVEQNTTVQTAVEGATVTVSCQYETTDRSPNFYWYQQKVNGVPKGMLSKFGFHKERFSGDLNTISKSFPLTIQDVHVSDSAVYYCALQATVTETYSTLIQNSE
uniref:Ig-like domain-containing protein n=1 Tax=Cyprinus carpio TaxID=7962 RepID=A0A8C2I6E2_CYPCA